jgi:hypothetical protein
MIALIIAFAMGLYVMGAIATFLLVGFFAALGGKNEDMWKPFVYAAFWPIALPVLFIWRK